MGTQRDVRVRITMEEAFQQAYTMSQLYVQSRPEPIPLSEHEARRKRKDMQEIVDVRTEITLHLTSSHISS